MNYSQGLREMTALAEEKGLKLTGHLQLLVKRAASGIEEVVVDQSNTIDTELKAKFRDTMNSNTDFALDNLQATQVAQASLSAALNGKDGITCNETTTPDYAEIIAFMASAVHPSDPSGNYYRQWQGVYQNLTGSAEDVESASIGQSFVHDPGGTASEWFDVDYAFSTFTKVTLQNNDILTVNWKITVG